MIRTLSAALVLLLCLRGTALADVLYTIEELLPLPGFTTAHAYSLNDSGQVVGYSWTPVDYWPERGTIAPMFWHEGSALALEPGALSGSGYIAMDINNAGQIVGEARNFGAEPLPLPDDITGNFGHLGSGGAGNVLWPEAGSWPIGSGPHCAIQDEWTVAITDSGYKLVTFGGVIYGLVSPNLDDPICGLTILELYESGAALTPQGYVYDLAGQWITSPTCPDALCDEVHDKMENASGQLIVNVGDRAFLLTPCSPFPGGGSTEGCFPGQGPFPGLPEPATLALIGTGLAGLAFSRRRYISRLQRKKIAASGVTMLKGLRWLVVVSFCFASASAQAAIVQFEYELWMQAETSLDQGPIEIQGRLVNTGSVALSLLPQWGAFGGLPQNLNHTTCGLECVEAQLSTAGSFLAPGNYLDFIWLSGTQEEDLSSRAGELVMGGLGLVPFGSDWHWIQGGFIPELLVHSTWVNGAVDPNLPFNVVLINLDVAHEYIEGCSPFPGGGSTEGCFPGSGPFPAPEPATLALLGIGLAGLAFSRRKRNV